MILAAGLGTRLGELTRIRPKPMLPICGTPLVRWAALWLRHHGVREVAINLHHLGEQITRELGDGTDLDLRIRYSHEEGMILGTGGGLRHARRLLDPGDGVPIVVVNGKVLLDLDLPALLRHHAQSGAEATMVLRPISEGEQWGTPLGARNGQLVSLLGETLTGFTPEKDLMFTGVHVFRPDFLDRVPATGKQCLIQTAYRQLFRAGGVGVFETDGYWWEHSTVERYLRGVANVLDGQVDLPFAEHEIRGVDETAVVEAGATLEDPVWVGPGARIKSGARVGPHVQVGAGVVIGPHRVRNAVVWDRARVDRDVDNDVITG